jgi:hypothetical protein
MLKEHVMMDDGSTETPKNVHFIAFPNFLVPGLFNENFICSYI